MTKESKMRLMPLVLLCVVYSTSYANSNNSLTHNLSPDGRETYYQQLEDLFEDGILPNEGDLTGWRSSRCFSQENQDYPFPMVLIGSEQDKINNPGPLFDDTKEVYLAAITHHNNDKPAISNRYDQITKKDMKQINTVFSTLMNKKSVKPAQEKNGSLVGQMKFNSIELKLRVRKYDQFLIFKSSFGEEYEEKNIVCYTVNKIK